MIPLIFFHFIKVEVGFVFVHFEFLFFSEGRIFLVERLIISLIHFCLEVRLLSYSILRQFEFVIMISGLAAFFIRLGLKRFIFLQK